MLGALLVLLAVQLSQNRLFADYALGNFKKLTALAQSSDANIGNSRLSADQKFMLAHAIRSYNGNTQLLDMDDEPFWIVNEGEYRMMNTFDLTVDQLFYELAVNPWTVRNELDMFVKRYSYEDKVSSPDDPTEYPGGISFTHDMGVANTLSRPGYSAYELYGLDDCFSHMTHEQLVNWTLCGATYVAHTDDQAWLQANLTIFEKCLTSMLLYLCQFVAREILDLALNETGTAADAAHVAWLTHPTLSIWSWSDQIISGEITGSKYYPRGVTSILWLQETK